MSKLAEVSDKHMIIIKIVKYKSFKAKRNASKMAGIRTEKAILKHYSQKIAESDRSSQKLTTN